MVFPTSVYIGCESSDYSTYRKDPWEQYSNSHYPIDVNFTNTSDGPASNYVMWRRSPQDSNRKDFLTTRGGSTYDCKMSDVGPDYSIELKSDRWREKENFIHCVDTFECFDCVGSCVECTNCNHCYNQRVGCFTCTAHCTSNCTTNCTATCTSQCTANCTAHCTNSCTAGCTASCANSCTSSCQGGCQEGCTSGCNEGCTSACNAGCTDNCNSGCDTDGVGCIMTTDCSGCTSGCTRGCTTACTAACTEGCDSSCTSECQNHQNGIEHGDCWSGEVTCVGGAVDCILDTTYICSGEGVTYDCPNNNTKTYEECYASGDDVIIECDSENVDYVICQQNTGFFIYCKGNCNTADYGGLCGTAEVGTVEYTNDDVPTSQTCVSCDGGCQGGCTSCDGSCTGDCASGCTDGCQGGCTSQCTTACTTACTGNCTTNCTTGCTSSCAAACAGSCTSSCQGGCTSSCAGACTSCDGCTSGCQGGCTSSCASGCTSCDGCTSGTSAPPCSSVTSCGNCTKGCQGGGCQGFWRG